MTFKESKLEKNIFIIFFGYLKKKFTKAEFA